ncbi:LysR family transcriptional regulator [Piscinibacter sakaiensis]|uniref:LysR family transcriptional regulator n=1 Tax=Piscinibacter sakaiensis TaxID=1547922 RepID=UPI003AAA7C3D
MRPMNFRTLDLNLLRVFDCVMVERNVTRAADRLSMTQPAVSNALRRLRQATHEELFVPGPAGMAPTTHAVQLWPVVRRALNDLQQAFVPQDFDPASEDRQFVLAMADATAALLVPVLLDALRELQSPVRLKVVGLSSRDPRELLEQGAIDAAIGFFPEVAAELRFAGETALSCLEPLYSCSYQCVMRAGHRLATPGALTLDSYCAADHLRVDFAGRPKGFVDEQLSRLGRSRRVAVSVDQFATAAAAVVNSDLLTVLPRSFVPATGLAPRLASRPLPFDLPAIDVGLLWHRRHEQDASQRWLRDTVQRAAATVEARLREPVSAPTKAPTRSAAPQSIAHSAA